MKKAPMVARLAMSFSLAAVLLLAIYGILVYSLFEHSVSEGLDSTLRSTADGVVESISTYWQTVDESGQPLHGMKRFVDSEDSPFFARMAQLWTRARAYGPILNNATLEILDSKGRSIAASQTMDPLLSLPPALFTKVLNSGPIFRDIRIDIASGGPQSYRSLSLPVRYGSSIVYVIQIIAPLSRLDAYLGNLRTLVLAFIPVGFVFSILAGWLGASSNIIPLRRMIDRIKAIGDRPAGLRLDEPDIVELADLAKSFNMMLERVDRSFETQADFFSDISHQLKTPLTILKGEMELTLRQDRDAATYKAAIKSGLEEVNRMTTLVQRMLALARLDSGQLQTAFVSADLGFLLRDLVSSLAKLALDKDCELLVRASSGIIAEVDSFSLREALSNLIANAIEHSPRGMPVEIALSLDADRVRFSVRDRGPGISPKDRERLFTRFQRGEGALGSGYGLGLAIARSVAESHRGRAGYEPRDPGSEFYLDIPKIRTN